MLALHLTRIVGPASPCWQVREGGPSGHLLGAVAAADGGYQASRVAAGGKLMLHWAADRDAAAEWLASVTPKHGRDTSIRKRRDLRRLRWPARLR